MNKRKMDIRTNKMLVMNLSLLQISTYVDPNLDIRNSHCQLNPVHVLHIFSDDPMFY